MPERLQGVAKDFKDITVAHVEKAERLTDLLGPNLERLKEFEDNEHVFPLEYREEVRRNYREIAEALLDMNGRLLLNQMNFLAAHVKSGLPSTIIIVDPSLGRDGVAELVGTTYRPQVRVFRNEHDGEVGLRIESLDIKRYLRLRHGKEDPLLTVPGMSLYYGNTGWEGVLGSNIPMQPGEITRLQFTGYEQNNLGPNREAGSIFIPKAKAVPQRVAA